MSYQQEIENIHIELKQLTSLLEEKSGYGEVQYEYKVVRLEEESPGLLQSVINYWAKKQNYQYVESIWMGEQLMIILERRKSD